MLYFVTQAQTVAPKGLFQPQPAMLFGTDSPFAAMELVRPESTPHPWGAAYAFARHLSGTPGTPHREKAQRMFDAYCLGLATGLLQLDTVPLPGTQVPGAEIHLNMVLAATSRFRGLSGLPPGVPQRELLVLIDPADPTAVPVAVYHPDMLFFPAAVRSNWPDDIIYEDGIREAALRLLVKDEFGLTIAAVVLDDLSALLRLIPAPTPGSPAPQYAWMDAANVLSGTVLQKTQGMHLPPAKGSNILPIGALAVSQDRSVFPAWQPRRVIRPELQALYIVSPGQPIPSTAVRKLDVAGNLSDQANNHLADGIKPAELVRDLGLPVIYGGSALDGGFYFIEDLPNNTGWDARPDPSKKWLSLTRGIGGCAVTIHIQVKCITLADVLCARIVVKRSGTGSPAVPDWPIRGGLVDLVEDCTLMVPAPGPTTKNAQYVVLFRNGQRVTCSPEIVDSIDPLVALWPDFVFPDWNLYRVYFSPKGAKSVHDWNLRVFYSAKDAAAADPQLTIDGAGSTGLYAVTDLKRRPAFVEILRVKPEEESLGIYRVPDPPTSRLHSQRPKQEERKLALDFGTSNTCAAYEFSRGNPGSRRGLSLTTEWVPVIGADLPATFTDAKFYDFAATDLKGLTEVPSELVAETLNVSQLLKDGTGLTLPRPEDPEEKMFGIISEGRLLSGFKWNDTKLIANEIIGASNLLIRDAASYYLKEVLQAACAQLVTQCRTLSILASYPAAFDEDQIVSYREALTEAITKVNELTGMQVSIEGYLDESTASIAARASANARYIMVIDVGGGTVDYGVSRGARAGQRGASSENDVSSMRFAGTHIIAEITRRAEALGLFGHGDQGNAMGDRVARIIRMSRSVRSWGSNNTGTRKRFWDELSRTIASPATGGFGGQAGASTARIGDLKIHAGSVIRNGLLAISYYGAVMLAARVFRDREELAAEVKGPVRVQVRFVGNGWSLIGLMDDTFPLWNVDSKSVEEDMARKDFMLCWESILQDFNGHAANKEPGSQIPDVQFGFERVRGKTETAIGLLAVTPKSELEIIKGRVLTEPIGVWLDVDDRPTGSDVPLQVSNLVVSPEPRFSVPRLMGMPEKLVAFLGGQGGEAAIRDAVTTTANTGQIISVAGNDTVLKASPLRRTLETLITKAYEREAVN